MDSQTRNSGIESLRELSNAVVRVKQCEQKLDELDAKDDDNSSLLNTLTTRQKFLEEFYRLNSIQNESTEM